MPRIALPPIPQVNCCMFCKRINAGRRLVPVIIFIKPFNIPCMKTHILLVDDDIDEMKIFVEALKEVQPVKMHVCR